MAYSMLPAPQTPIFDAPFSPNTPTGHSPYRDEFNPYEQSHHARESTAPAAYYPTPPAVHPQHTGTGRKLTKQRPQQLRSQVPSYASRATTLYDQGPDFESGHLYTQQGWKEPEASTSRQTDFLKPIYAEPPPSARPHPFSSNLEAPEWMKVIVHLILCLIAYPVLLGFSALAENKTLFWARFIVGVACGLVGFLLGFSLLELGKSFLEAATWATLIHQSNTVHAPGIRLRDLAAVTSQDATSAWGGIRLLWSRMMYPGTARRSRRTYDSRPWSLFIFFFLFLVILAASLPFIMGRILDIRAVLQHQSERYYEVAVKGDISAADIANVGILQDTFASRFAVTWRLSASSQGAILPAPLELDWQQKKEKVYFAELARSQLLPNGSGFGTFTSDSAMADDSGNTGSMPERSTDLSRPMEPGTLLRFPRWGIRIHCEKLSNPDHIIPRTPAPNGFTYAFIPRDLIGRLFAHFGKPYPAVLDAPLNITNPRVIAPGDTFPSNLNPADFASSGYWYDNKASHSFKSSPMTMGAEGDGWVTIETVMVRLNTTYAPRGRFLKLSDLSLPDENGTATFIGYDAAVCLELYEPYIVEAFNSSIGLPTTTRIVSQSKVLADSDPLKMKEENTRPSLNKNDLIRELNSTRLAGVYEVVHGNSVNQMLKDNGQDSYYVPNPTLLTFTRGEQVPNGYTELDPEAFGRARAMADATYALPYFAGTGETVARSFPDAVVSKVRINLIYVTSLLGLVFVVGLIAGLCVPKLPLHVPRRGFELYSWLALLQGQELIVDHDMGIEKNMTIEDIQQRMGNMRFRYVT